MLFAVENRNMQYKQRLLLAYAQVLIHSLEIIFVDRIEGK
jgi:hypothetical protein